MFTKGPRFESVKISDMPGPNTYNVPAHTPQQPYKRGAFLEKADRFSQERKTESPAPNTICEESDKKPTKFNSGTAKTQADYKALSERYTALQRKVDDLEKVHEDGKKSYHEQTEKLKSELSRYQKSNAEQSDRLEKQKKQIDLLEARVQEVKKLAASKEVDTKDTKLKLKLIEKERAQLVSKQGEWEEARKSLEVLENRQKDELRGKEKHITELQKDLASARRKQEMAEAQAKDLEAKTGAEVARARKELQSIETTVSASAQLAFDEFKEQANQREQDLLKQLECHRDLVKRIAGEYGRLASQTVPLLTYQRLQEERTQLELRTLTLDRRLQNSESQVTELAHLIRQTKEKNILLQTNLCDAEERATLQHYGLIEASSLTNSLAFEITMHGLADNLSAELGGRNQEEYTLTYATLSSIAEAYQLSFRNFFFECLALDARLREEQLTTRNYGSTLSSIQAELVAKIEQIRTSQDERAALEGNLRLATVEVSSLKTSSANMTHQVKDMEEKMISLHKRCEDAVLKESRIVKECNATVQRSKMAEQALRSEIDSLASELAEASRYQEAYYALSDEVGALVARNRLAEDEAQKLSKFNAEILSHTNPAQRILYVDRIRRELAEIKHDLAMKTREHEAAVALGEELQHELDMYISVAVPPSHKPRSNMTRVSRVPLGGHNSNLHSGRNSTQASAEAPLATDGLKENRRMPTGSSRSSLEAVPGDMTLDEIS